MKRRIIYISDNTKPPAFLASVLDRIADAANRLHMELTTVTREPMHRGHGRYLYEVMPKNARGYWPGIFHAYLIALAHCADDDEVYCTDDDALYPDEHFALPVAPAVCFNLEIVYLGMRGWFEMYRRGCCNNNALFGTAAALRRAFAWKLDELARGDFVSYEPAEGGPRPYSSCTARTVKPVVDVRIWNHTWTPDASTVYRQENAHWGNATTLLQEIMAI